MVRLASFGPFELDCVSGELFRDGVAVDLAPNATKVLVKLVTCRGRLVSHDTLYESVWGDTVVEYDQALYKCVRQIRQALCDDARNPTYVETIPRRGYRFCYTESRKRNSQAFRKTSYRYVAAIMALAICLYIFSIPTTNPALKSGQVSLAAFRIDGFKISTGGIDSYLESSVKRGLMKRGVSVNANETPYVITGTIVSTPEGALFQASLVRSSDNLVMWHGEFNPFCPEFKGDPVPYIGQLVARAVESRIS